MLNFQAVLLIARGDPKGYEEKEALEREVNGLESYLEAMPSLVVLAYLKRVDPEFLDRLGLFSFSRPFLQTCFTMTLPEKWALLHTSQERALWWHFHMEIHCHLLPEPVEFQLQIH